MTDHDQQAQQLRHERDLLAEALGSLLVRLGVVEDVPLTGPQLLDAADQVQSAPQSGDTLAVNDRMRGALEAIVTHEEDRCRSGGPIHQLAADGLATDDR